MSQSVISILLCGITGEFEVGNRTLWWCRLDVRDPPLNSAKCQNEIFKVLLSMSTKLFSVMPAIILLKHAHHPRVIDHVAMNFSEKSVDSFGRPPLALSQIRHQTYTC